MKYATTIQDIKNAFSPEPLKGRQMDEFYCNNTMEYRTSDKYISPIEDISDICQRPENRSAFLLLGHKGCGKSTELNRMSSELVENGYQVRTIHCSRDLDLFNIVYSDLLILIGEALLSIAEEHNWVIEEELLSQISAFWDQTSQVTVQVDDTSASLETGVLASTPKLLTGLIQLFANMKTELKYNEETRKEFRKRVSVRSSQWMGLIIQLVGQIMEQSGGRQPILIFEDLDKLNPEDAWKVFYHYAAILSGMPFPVIYTFPIGLTYDSRFPALEGYFITKTLPMIKIETIDGCEYTEGMQIIRKIVAKRADLSLFEEGVLDNLIRYTGGSLRDLFYCINTAGVRAERRKSSKLDMEDGERALEELKTSITRRIEKGDYEFLLNIYNGSREQIEDKQNLLKQLQASVVLEYNGKRWHNLHPLIVCFFKEQGLIKDGE